LKSGLWIFVCGPSGAGKDSIIAFAKQELYLDQRFCFSSRYITRVDKLEKDQVSISQEKFDEMYSAGNLVWAWQAHGYSYGISSTYRQKVNEGRIVVINGSRAHAALNTPHPDIRVVQINALEEYLVSRLNERGRENSDAQSERIKRNSLYKNIHFDIQIQNNESIESAAKKFIDYLLSLRG
jgi:ribose 1,5-bisphosphokinase